MRSPAARRQMELFDKSVLKQAKWRQISSLLPAMDGLRGLDLGGDNGTLSLLLRERGGRWASADLGERSIESIRAVVDGDVHGTDGRTLPFPDGEFHVVVVLDMLEHVEDDRTLVAEIARVTRPGGTLIANVPHRKLLPALRPVRNLLGLTDRWHGHVRPGYTVEELRRLLEGAFEMGAHRTYNRFFSEALDIALNAAYVRRSGDAGGGAKGTVVTAGDLHRHQRSFRLYSRLYPLMKAVAGLDTLALPFSGYSLIVEARRRPSVPPG